MTLYNSLTQKNEQVEGGPHKRVNLFVCGPTVYAPSHIGHARTYIVYDALVKYLRAHLGWDVFYLQNITNIDDKIIVRAHDEAEDPLSLAQKEQVEYEKDMTSLGVSAVNIYAPATDYIDELIIQVSQLLKSNKAYAIDDGIYFDISTFADYGRLSHRLKEDAEESQVSRIDEDINKKNKGDFAIWKFARPGEPSWDAPFGAGRPGWHIEDTAIAHKHFGYTYDIHGGGLDLKFPHHEAEIAIMESLSGVSPMVKLWVHTGMLTVNGEKMSKSVGNVMTIKEFLAEQPAEVLRMLVFTSHYRSPVDFTENALDEAASKVERLSECLVRLSDVTTMGVSPFPMESFIGAFWEALKTDFNTPKAFSELFQLVTETNKLIDAHSLSKSDAQKLLAFLQEINAIFMVIPHTESTVPEDVSALIAKREEARAEGRYEDADILRAEIEKRGFQLKDTPHGARVTRNK